MAEWMNSLFLAMMMMMMMRLRLTTGDSNPLHIRPLKRIDYVFCFVRRTISDLDPVHRDFNPGVTCVRPLFSCGDTPPPDVSRMTIAEAK